MWDMRIVAVDFVVFGGNGCIAKMSRGIGWSEGLLIGNPVVDL